MSCSRQLLADCDWGKLERCSCGTVHLTMGALSLRLVPEVLADFARMFGAAAERVMQDDAGECDHHPHYAS